MHNGLFVIEHTFFITNSILKYYLTCQEGVYRVTVQKAVKLG